MERNKKKKNVEPNELKENLFDLILQGRLAEAALLTTNPKCNVNLPGSNGYGTTSLMQASADNYFFLVKLLLRRQTLLINQRTIDGDSALIWSSIEGSTECIELLVDDSRIDVNLVGYDGHSALWHAYIRGQTPVMKLLISHGAKVEGVAESVLKYMKENGLGILASFEATEVMENWKSYLPEFTRFAKTNKYYPSKFRKWAFNFILYCLKSRSFPKDIIHLLLEYIARAWKRI